MTTLCDIDNYNEFDRVTVKVKVVKVNDSQIATFTTSRLMCIICPFDYRS